ncbi:MAG: hypothetical protein MJY89_01280 [Bacteroidales bacterium]|nr:hypothetical protein [Bacteroidales bacterium]
MKKFLIALALGCLFAGCTKPLSDSVYGSEGPAIIYPDYKETTVPPNIAPLNFHYAVKGASRATTTFTIGEKSITKHGTEVSWNLRQWKKFLSEASGKTISVRSELKVGNENISDAWHIFVSEDSIDPFLTYRLIEPAYQMWNEVSIMERNIENFNEQAICDYGHTDNSCMNCHIHSQQRGDLSMFYIRGKRGGAILNRDGELRKLTLNVDGMISGTVYGEVHPSGRYGVFSTNVVIPSFHSMAGKRMEVYDTASDLTVADFDNDRMINLPHVARKDKFETFPCFSADGNHVFFCVADTVSVPEQLTELKYSLVRAPFDVNTGHIGKQLDTIWNGLEHNASACHPKASPDGRWVMFTKASYGTFPINHSESALTMVNLETGEINPLEPVKGDKSDTYHSWSSSGRWFVFASKRGDGQYGKPYFCHLDENGNPSKPFVLPQKSAYFYEYNLKSFNIPDLGKSSTGISLSDSRRMYKAESEAFE